MSDMSLPTSLPDALRALLGDRGVLIEDIGHYGEDWRRLYHHTPRAVLRPADAAELAAAVQLCVAHGVPMVPQGGNTSMVGGGVPCADGQVVISLARMNCIRAIDPVDMTMTVEAGVTLKAAQNAAADAGCLLPLSISAEGTAQIGGILATNAGGNRVIRYGMARDSVLGLEVVLAAHPLKGTSDAAIPIICEFGIAFASVLEIQ